ncbi:MAG: hypothetical protein IJS15_02740 [Victivallales bacterium]|nr:hypothetical protein [Victivallales bacterium]
MMNSHKRHSRLFKEGEAAFLRGDYNVAEASLRAYLAKDKDKEEAWKYMAEIKESRRQWFEAARIWRRLVSLNVMNDEYLSRCIKSHFIIHDYAGLGEIFDKYADNRCDNYLDIYALTMFKINPKNAETNALIESLPAWSSIKRLILAMKNLGPSSELEALKKSADRTVQVEAYILDASIAEVKERNLERAEQNYRKAAELDKRLCLAELGDFLFRNNRYNEAAEIFGNPDTLILYDTSFLNYAEILFFMKNLEELQKLEKRITNNNSHYIAIRAYIQSLIAFLAKKPDIMAKNYEVAQIYRTTPMGLVLTYAVGVEKHDIALVVEVLRHWKSTMVFKERKEMIINDAKTLIAGAIQEQKFQDGASLARLLADVEPPEPLVWHALLLEQASRNKISDALLNKAIELFPNDTFIRSFALRAAFVKGDNSEIVKAYDEIIAVSKTPFTERYRKALYFERRGMNDEAFAEIRRLLEEDNTLEEAKHCLAFGMRTGNKAALELAGKSPELASIAKFEIERRHGDAETAVKILKEQEIEKGLNAESIADREILLPLAIYLGLVGEHARAVTALEALKPYTRSSPTVELNLSEVYAMQGNRELAMSNAESAYSRFQNSTVTKAVYGLRCAENNDFQKAADLISDSATEPRFRTTLIHSLEKNIETTFGDGHYITCKNNIKRLLELQPDNNCAKEHQQKLDALKAEAENQDND